jgi:hypothetical protein
MLKIIKIEKDIKLTALEKMKKKMLVEIIFELDKIRTKKKWPT